MRSIIILSTGVYRFSEDSNKFFNWIVLLQFFTSAVSIGLTMFQLTVVGLSNL
jgi:hypothetical protein